MSAAAVLAAARAAAGDDEPAQSWLESLFDEGVLSQYAETGDAALREVDRRWREGFQQFAALWEAAAQAEERWRQQPRDVGGTGKSHVVNVDDLMYVASGRFAPPAARTVHGALIVAQADSAYVDALRGEITSATAKIAGFCPWFDAIWEKAQRDPAGIVAARALLAHAQQDAEMEERRQAATAEVHARLFDDARAEMCSRITAILMLVPTGDKDLEPGAAERLLEDFTVFQRACTRVLEMGGAAPGYDALRLATERLSMLAFGAQSALGRCEEVRGINAIFLAPQRLIFGVAVLGVVVYLRVPAFILAALGVVVAAVVYRWYIGFHATEDALGKLRTFGLHARTFLRKGSRTE
ncbi:MAG: hypothetical protein ABI569_03370 [Casimicrobiaceae bacterium]